MTNSEWHCHKKNKEMELIISLIKSTQGWIQSEIRVQIHGQGIWDNKAKNSKRLTIEYIQIQEVQIQSRITLKISGIFKNIIKTEGKIQSSFEETKQNEKLSSIRIIQSGKSTITNSQSEMAVEEQKSENTNPQIQNEIEMSIKTTQPSLNQYKW